MNSRGSEGGDPLVKIAADLGGSAPQNSCVDIPLQPVPYSSNDTPDEGHREGTGGKWPQGLNLQKAS